MTTKLSCNPYLYLGLPHPYHISMCSGLHRHISRVWSSLLQQKGYRQGCGIQAQDQLGSQRLSSILFQEVRTLKENVKLNQKMVFQCRNEQAEERLS